MHTGGAKNPCLIKSETSSSPLHAGQVHFRVTPHCAAIRISWELSVLSRLLIKLADYHFALSSEQTQTDTFTHVHKFTFVTTVSFGSLKKSSPLRVGSGDGYMSLHGILLVQSRIVILVWVTHILTHSQSHDLLSVLLKDDERNNSKKNPFEFVVQLTSVSFSKDSSWYALDGAPIPQLRIPLSKLCLFHFWIHPLTQKTKWKGTPNRRHFVAIDGCFAPQWFDNPLFP